MFEKKQPAIIVSNITKSFRIPLDGSTGIKQKIVNGLTNKKGYRTFTPLNDISFTIEEGEFFGIVGRNGSGKSTLLKTMAGIYTPDNGYVKVNGKLVPFIELGVGFNPELTGRENVYLNGALLGFSRDEMTAMYEEIVDFAELHEFMEEQLKNYSSGMQVRLAFSIAIRARGDVLLLDEVLAVGDEAFQRKCYSYFAELKKQRKTVVLVTHSMNSVQQFCDRAMLIKEGEIAYIGNTATASLMYRDENSPKEEATQRQKNGLIVNDRVEISAELKNKSSDKELKFIININPKEDMDDVVAAISVTRETGEIVYRWASNEKMSSKFFIKEGKKITFAVNIQNIFPNGKFLLNLGLRNLDMTEYYASADGIIKFEIINTSSYPTDAYWKPDEQVKIDYDD